LVIICGLLGILTNRESIILFLICLEICYIGFMFLTVYQAVLSGGVESLVYFIILIVLVATEAVLGLLLIVKLKRLGKSIDLGVLLHLSD